MRATEFSRFPGKFKKMPGKKGLVLSLIVLAALAIGLYVFLGAGRNANEADAAANSIAIALGNIDELVTAQGTLEPKEYVDVGTQVSGQLKKIHIDLGQTVKKDMLLAEIDPQIYLARVEGDEARLRALKAQIAQQQAQLTLATQKYERNQRLVASKAISQEVMEQSTAERAAAAARLAELKAQNEEAQSTLRGSRANLDYTQIYAPMDGTVVVINARQGQTLNANQTAPIVLQLANLDTMTVRAQVAEADVMRLEPGMKVYFTTLGMLEHKWWGTVRQIQPSPEIVNDVVLYVVLIDVDNADRKLMTGMTTQVFFVIGEGKQVPLIPIEALGPRLANQDNASGKAYAVRVASGDGFERRIIHVGLMNRTEAEVRAGLAPGDRVALTKAASPRPAGQRMGRGPRL